MEMKRIMNMVSHPRAAVIIHDFCMVVGAWLAAVWAVQSISATPVSNNLSTLTVLLIVLALQGGVFHR